jgi:mannose-6-phosphate isomerase
MHIELSYVQIAVMELRCTVQQYAWGKLGLSSEVALLNRGGDLDFVVYETMPYAELWMGTHPNGPSILKGSSQKLLRWIQAHPDSLGAKVTEKFGVQLPFLFKVLSIRQALSIQAHPDKVLHQFTKPKQNSI